MGDGEKSPEPAKREYQKFMKRTRYYWDVETAALPEDQLLIPEFESAKNLRDPEKIKADIADKRAAWLGGCALRGTTGQVIAFSSVWDDESPQFKANPHEGLLLDKLFQDLSEVISQGAKAYSWSNFDVVFTAQRCAVWDIPAFKSFTTCYRGRWSWRENFTDPMQIWCGPGQRHDGASLKAVAYALGLGLKEGSGADFAALLKTAPEAARLYSIRDTTLLRQIVRKMGL